MDDMKGVGTTVVHCVHHEQRFELIRFADGSLSIHRDGHSIGVWEPAEQKECCLIFTQLIGSEASSLSPAGFGDTILAEGVLPPVAGGYRLN